MSTMKWILVTLTLLLAAGLSMTAQADFLCELAKLTASDAGPQDWFGLSVSISDDYAVVGASLEDTGGSNAGAAYVFVRSGTVWSEQAKLTASDAQANSLFGQSVSISGDFAVIGADGEDTGGDSAVAAYGFGLASPPCLTIDAYLAFVPASGTVPFTTTMTVTLSNNYIEQLRTFAGHIEVTLANDTSFSNWRAGYTNLSAGDSYITSFPVMIPAAGTVIGNNLFMIVVEDVTPAPYNQPPYPPAGDTDTATCTVTGIAP